LKHFSSDLSIMPRIQVDQTGPDGDYRDTHSLRRIPARSLCLDSVQEKAFRAKAG